MLSLLGGYNEGRRQVLPLAVCHTISGLTACLDPELCCVVPHGMAQHGALHSLWLSPLLLSAPRHSWGA